MKIQRYNVIIMLTIILVMSYSILTNAEKKSNKKLESTNLSIVEKTENNITINWKYVKNATGYKVYFRRADDSTFLIAGTAYSTSFIHYDLTPNTTYEYYVQPYNKFITSDNSNIVQVTTMQTNGVNTISIEAETQDSDSMSVLGYATYYYNGDESSLNSMKNTNLLDGIITHTYISDGFGNLIGLIPIKQIEYAKKNDIKAYISITNNFKGKISHEILSSAENRLNLIENIKEELIKYDLNGVNIDMEGIYYYDRNNYSLFIKELYQTLSPLGYEVSIAVPAKTWDNPVNSWNGAFDYNALSNYSDKLILMTYDEHFGAGSSGPIASINWGEKVLKYATSAIPNQKIILGLASYGYDWSSEGYRAYGVSKCYEVAYANKATIIWDSESQSPYYNYTDSDGVYHTVWYENEYSIKYKLRLVKNYNIEGIAIWRLGLENDAYWESIYNYL